MNNGKMPLVMAALVPVGLALVVGGFFFNRRFGGDETGVAMGNANVAQPAPLAQWPWPDATEETLHKGVSHWQASSSDGTTVDLIEFDWQANPQLRWEIFDQDEDDDAPYNNVVPYWKRGVGEMTRQLNAKKTGPVLAVWNGLFFGYKSPDITDVDALASHVSPVVLKRKVYFNTANHRWAFGVKYTPQGPVWKKKHLPSRLWLEQNLDWGGGSAQCLLDEGKPLHLQPFPAPGAPPLPQPVKSTPADVGHIPVFDHMKTCRASVAWSPDNKKLFLLFVKESDSETESAMALKYRQKLQGGWTVPDLQQFWLSFQKSVPGMNGMTAMNSDAGDVAQMTYIHPDGKYTLVPPRWANAGFDRDVFTPDFKNAPHGGSIMFFYVRDAEGK